MNNSFIQDCLDAVVSHEKNKERERQLSMDDWHQKYDGKMYELTSIYHDDLKKSIMTQSNKGVRELYYNLSWEHFKFNLPNTGKPSKMCAVWLNQMCSPDSIYLCADLKDGVVLYRDHFQGLHFDVWNNAAFTVHFTW